MKYYLPALADHPYRDFAACFCVDERRQPDVHRELLLGIKLCDPEPTALPLIDALRGYDRTGANPGSAAARLVTRHRDATADDLLGKLRFTDVKLKLEAARALRVVSPYTTAAVVILIENDWPGVKAQAAEFEKTYGESAAVLSALGRKFAGEKRHADAERCLRSALRLSPDMGGYVALADLYKAQGDTAKWRETLEVYLKTEDSGLAHAQVRVQIVRHLIKEKKFAEAKPYALAAAETGAAWAQLTAAEVFEGLGQWADAEQWVKETAGQYEGSRPTWFFWCVRTGRGDLPAARKLVEDRVGRLQGGDDSGLLFTVMALHVTAGKPDQALAALRDFAATNTPSKSTLMYIALLADELGFENERDECLEKIVNPPKPKPADPKAPPRPAPRRAPDAAAQARLKTLTDAQTELAKLFRDVLAAPAGKLDAAKVEAILKTVDGEYKSEAGYLVGRFLELRGHPADAERYYKPATEPLAANRLGTALSAYRYRNLKTGK
jgi:uncharacterized protein HemY